MLGTEGMKEKVQKSWTKGRKKEGKIGKNAIAAPIIQFQFSQFSLISSSLP